MATKERLTSNACNAVRDFNAYEAGAIIECLTSNACNAVRDFNADKSVATIERLTSNYIIFAIVVNRQYQLCSITQVSNQCIYIIWFTKQKIAVYKAIRSIIKIDGIIGDITVII